MIPSLFVSHGSPMLALDPGPFRERFAAVGARLHAATAIVAMSPHLHTHGCFVGSGERLDAIHDFSGFPPALYEIRWQGAGAPHRVAGIVQALRDGGIPAESTRLEGVDHGVWVPLSMMYPQGAPPLVQVSIDAGWGPRQAWQAGRGLAALRSDDVLVLGSGSITHNLRELDWPDRDAPAAAWATGFVHWFGERLLADDLDALFDYRSHAPDAVRAHPTDEHLLPLFFALGAGGGAAERVIDGVTHATLAMDAWLFGEES